MQNKPVVVIDTNALMMPFQFSINISLELNKLLGLYTIKVPSCCIHELEGLSKENRFARSGLRLAEKYAFIEVQELGDKGVIEALQKEGTYLLTNDSELRGKAFSQGFGVILMRKRKYLVLETPDGFDN